VSPILVRPVREQFEHDRVIRVLQARYKRKYEVAINPGPEQNASVSVGELAMYPDLVLFSPERGRKIQAVVEVETTESINTLEALAEWGPFSRLRTAFFLYVPASTIDTVRRLCTEHTISPTEIWTYHAAMDQVRFTMVQRAPEAARADTRAGRTAAARPPRPGDSRPAQPPRVAETRPDKAAPPGPRGANGQAAESRPKPEKAKAPKKLPAVRRAKSAKKPASAKKLPRAAVARPRQAAKAKKAARKSSPKRSATPKR
jgi:hypothetical protein